MSDEALESHSQAVADDALAHLRVDALFTRDRQGDLLTLNELEPIPPPTPAPRIYLGVTAGGIVRAYRPEVPAALRVAVDALGQGQELLGHPREDLLAALRGVLAAQVQQGEAWEISSGPAFVFPEHTGQSAGVVAIEPAQADLLAAHFPFTATWLRERWPCYAVIVDDQSVSICYSARRTAHVAEAGVDTADAFRGRGYAALVTAAWAQAVRAAGIAPVYSTSDDNHASQAVARKLGLREFGWDVSIG